MITASDYRIIDWMTACRGDKRADAARTFIMLRFSRMPRVPAIVNYFVRIFQKQILKNYLKGYLKLTGVSAKEIHK